MFLFILLRLFAAISVYSGVPVSPPSPYKNDVGRQPRLSGQQIKHGLQYQTYLGDFKREYALPEPSK
jgi:hypothetical protein